MKSKILVLVSFFIGIQCLYNTKSVHSYSPQPPIFNSGPGADQASCGSGDCHNSNPLNTGNGTVEIDFSGSFDVYGVNETYDISLKLEKEGAMRFGFQMVAFNSDKESVGSFIADENQNTGIQNSSGIEFINHKDAVEATNSYTYNFQWQAPSADAGEITFFVSANTANGANGASGDYIYTSSKSINFTTSTGLETIEKTSINIFPNPGNGIYSISNLPAESSSLMLIDSKGEVMLKNISGNQIDISEKANGLYFLIDNARSFDPIKLVKH